MEQVIAKINGTVWPTFFSALCKATSVDQVKNPAIQMVQEVMKLVAPDTQVSFALV